MGINDPFINHSLHFSTSKKSLEEVSVMRKLRKNETAKKEKDQFSKKRKLLDNYQATHGIHIPFHIVSDLMKQVDDTGMLLYLEKRLRTKKENMAARQI